MYERKKLKESIKKYKEVCVRTRERERERERETIRRKRALEKER